MILRKSDVLQRFVLLEERCLFYFFFFFTLLTYERTTYCYDEKKVLNKKNRPPTWITVVNRSHIDTSHK